jgi:stage II sporulation protein D
LKDEALKAQAIASRSYALSQVFMMIYHYNISSSINDQVYQTNYELQNKWQDKYDMIITTKIKDAVTATQNLVIKRDNKILKTYYFSMSNGQTENSLDVFNIPVFESVSSPYEESLPNFKINKTYSTSELKTLFNLNTITIGEIKRNKTNHVTSVIINNEEYTGIQIRKLLNLRSTDFTIVQNGSDYIFTTKGYGHGVGMSQYGANEMAKLGKNYIDILKHYYKNTKITKI